MKCKTVSMYDGVKTHYLGTLTSYRYRLCLLSPELILLDIVARVVSKEILNFLPCLQYRIQTAADVVTHRFLDYRFLYHRSTIIPMAW